MYVIHCMQKCNKKKIKLKRIELIGQPKLSKNDMLSKKNLILIQIKTTFRKYIVFIQLHVSMCLDIAFMPNH